MACACVRGMSVHQDLVDLGHGPLSVFGVRDSQEGCAQGHVSVQPALGPLGLFAKPPLQTTTAGTETEAHQQELRVQSSTEPSTWGRPRAAPPAGNHRALCEPSSARGVRAGVMSGASRGETGRTRTLACLSTSFWPKFWVFGLHRKDACSSSALPSLSFFLTVSSVPR